MINRQPVKYQVRRVPKNGMINSGQCPALTVTALCPELAIKQVTGPDVGVGWLGNGRYYVVHIPKEEEADKDDGINYKFRESTEYEVKEVC